MDRIPSGFLQCEPTRIGDLLPGPTLIHIKGKIRRPLFVSILLHGNETTGLLAMQRILSYYQGTELPRSLILFIGNVQAASIGKRQLEGGADYNRIWSPGGRPEQLMTREVVTRVAGLHPLACIDIHNNTGRNPLYTIVPRREAEFLSLASRFGRKVVYATSPDNTCAAAFSRHCPSVTVEAGLPGETEGVDAVVRFVSDALELPNPLRHVSFDIDLYHSAALVRVAPECTCGPAGGNTDIELDPGIESFNFKEVLPGTCLARVKPGAQDCVKVHSFDSGEAGHWVEIYDGELTVTRPLVPAMLTSDPDIIRWDCLCYLMERLE